MRTVPTGRWVVAVSGGADSVALLRLLCERPDLSLVVAHLNHQTRGQENADDAQFVQSLADELQVRWVIESRDEIERSFEAIKANRSARYREARHAFFATIINRQNARGVVLAHHRDDQAETIMHRLIRGSGYAGLCGMSPTESIRGLTISRPLLDASRDSLRKYLNSRGQSWREDPSNASDHSERNRIRKILIERPKLTDLLIDLGDRCRALREWTNERRHDPSPSLKLDVLIALPGIVLRESIRHWLAMNGVPSGLITPDVIDRVTRLVSDAASPNTVNVPGDRRVRRRQGAIVMD